MSGSTRDEVEVKLSFSSAAAARGELQRIGASERHPRSFEDNILLERAADPLMSAGKALRLRRYGERSILTFKAPVPGIHRHKVREEHESIVDDGAAVKRILAGLGFSPWYRYQKYRTVFELDDLQLCLDETPIGCFVELEGRPDAIDRAAETLGYGEEQYVLQSYRELHERAARARGEEPGDMVFEGRDEVAP